MAQDLLTSGRQEHGQLIINLISIPSCTVSAVLLYVFLSSERVSDNCFVCAAQFQADVHDAWHLMRNLFDANALSLTYGSSVQSLDQFTQAYFGFAVGLDHHSDEGGKDHLISGLNTTGSLVPITFSVNMT